MASEIEKDLLISKLSSSSTFADTHTAVAKLNQFTDFTDTQANAIISAAANNNQVHWILSDDDVRVLIESVIAEREDRLGSPELDFLMEQLALADEFAEDAV